MDFSTRHLCTRCGCFGSHTATATAVVPVGGLPVIATGADILADKLRGRVIVEIGG